MESPAAALTRTRREHRTLLGQLLKFEDAWAAPDVTARSRARRATLSALLDICERRITPHLETEEIVLYPRVHEHLPEETGTLDAALREHDTLRELVAFLRLRSERASKGDARAEDDIAITLHDLVELWRVHVRRLDEVVGPLLDTLVEAPRG